MLPKKQHYQQQFPRDVFRSYLVGTANYDGELDIPIVRSSHLVPERVIPFSKALRSKDYDAWVMFYEHDKYFLCVWRNPRKYLPILKRFRGVIAPDFSVYRNMPLVMQAWAVYMSRALAHWWQENGIEVIPNIRFGTPASYPFAFSGIEKRSIVAVSNHGCFKRKRDREYFLQGFAAMVKTLHPKTIILYGSAPEKHFANYIEQGVTIVHFPSDFGEHHKAVK